MQAVELDVTRLMRGLYIGSAPPPGHHVAAQFDCLVLCAREYQPPGRDFPRVSVVHCPFDDTQRPSEYEVEIAFRGAELVAKKLRYRHRVLVTCRQGRNRSGLVCALALHMITGRPGRECADLIARHRVGPDGHPALTNQAFRHLLDDL